MAMKVRHMRTSTSSSGVGHFHYIDYIDSSGNGQTKQFISKRTKQRHIHKIRNFVVRLCVIKNNNQSIYCIIISIFFYLFVKD